MDKELKDQRVVVMLSKTELDLIDDWMFANRVRSRGEAIRQLCRTRILRDMEKIKDARVKRAISGE